MTSTISVNVRTELYNKAQQYAKEHNTSVDKMLDTLLITFLMNGGQQKRLKRPSNFSPELLNLVGIAKNTRIQGDLNGEKARWDYIKTKYDL